jgi:Ca2+-binding RTX toxin-like protein
MPTGAPTVEPSLTLSAVAPSDVVLSPDGLKIYTSSDNGIVRIYSGETGAYLKAWRVGTDLGAIDVSPDGRFLYVVEDYIPSGASAKVYQVDAATGAVTAFRRSTRGDEGAFTDVAALSNGKVLLTQELDGVTGWVHMKLLTPSTGSFDIVGGPQQDVRSGSLLTRSLDGSQVLVAEVNISDAQLRIYKAGVGLVAASGNYDDDVSGFNRGVQAFSGATGMAAQHVGGYQWDPSGVGFHIYDAGLQYQQNFGSRYPSWLKGVSGLAFSADGALLFVLDNDADRIYQVSTSSWEILDSFPIGLDILRSDAGGYGNHLLVGPGMRYFTVVSEQGLQRVDNPAVDEAIDGTAGNDRLIGTYWSEVLNGLDGHDRLDGRGGTDTMIGGKGHDTYVVDNVDDLVIENGSSGNDTVETLVDYGLPIHFEKLILLGTGNIDGRGNAGANAITGNSGANLINGGSGNDVIDAGAGDDRIYGHTGNDTLSGGTGLDRFLFNSALGSSNVDKILDFYTPNDSLYLSRSVFTKAGANGTLDPSVFHQGTSAADSGDRIVYDQASGKIFYDSDGSGAAAAILFATVSAGTALTNADFIIYS